MYIGNHGVMRQSFWMRSSAIHTYTPNMHILTHIPFVHDQVVTTLSNN